MQKLVTVKELIEILQTLPQDAIVTDKHNVAIKGIRNMEEKVAYIKGENYTYFTTVAKLAEYKKDNENLLKKARKRGDEDLAEKYVYAIENLRKNMANPLIYKVVSI